MDFPVGTRVRFERGTPPLLRRKVTGTVEASTAHSYVVRADTGGIFIRWLDEVEEVSE